MKAAVEGGRGRKRVVEAAAPEPALWGLVGNTPLIPLPPSTALARPLPSVLLKAEWLNPGGSVKDRPALYILRDGLARGELPAKRVLDASSGNTAIADAMLGAAAGIGVTMCVPANASAERKALLETYGAEVIFTDPLDGSDGATSTGPIAHAYSSAGSHQVTLSCTGEPSQSATVGAVSGSATSAACLHLPSGVVPDAFERILVQLGFGVCRH